MHTINDFILKVFFKNQETFDMEYRFVLWPNCNSVLVMSMWRYLANLNMKVDSNTFTDKVGTDGKI